MRYLSIPFFTVSNASRIFQESFNCSTRMQSGSEVMNLAETVTQQTTVKVNALLRGDQIRLINRRGDPISKWLSTDTTVGNLFRGVNEFLKWKTALTRVASNLNGRARARSQTPWQRKVDVLAKSFHLRGMSLPSDSKPTQRQLHEPYSTFCWKSAVKRLWTQANNRYRRHARSGWDRWSTTVANNHNKRKGGRYSRS